MSRLRHVGYRGTQPAILDLVGGQVSAVSGPVGEFTQNVKAGKIRLLATSGTERTRFAPDTATFVEQGFPSVASDEWFGFFMPGKSSRCGAAGQCGLARGTRRAGRDRRPGADGTGIQIVDPRRTGAPAARRS